MITAASLKTLNAKDLGQMAKSRGVSGWQEMKRDQLVRALLRAKAKPAKPALAKSASAKSKSASPPSRRPTPDKRPTAAARAAARRTPPKPSKAAPASRSVAAPAAKRQIAPVAKAPVAKSANKLPKPAPKLTAKAVARASKPVATKPIVTKLMASKPAAKPLAKPSPPAKMVKLEKPKPIKAVKGVKQASPTKPLTPEAQKKIHDELNRREKLKDLSAGAGGLASTRDRIVLMVRDAFWLHCHWELTRAAVDRAKAALAEHWHAAKPCLRVVEVETGSTTSTAERVAKFVEIHGGVRNWFIDVANPPKSFRVDIGYQASNGKFHSLARSNVVSTPSPGTADFVDENWADDAQSYDKIFAMSGGTNDNHGDLQDLFEERLKRPMGPPATTKFGLGAQRALGRKPDRDFKFEVDADMIVYGSTKPGSYVTLNNEPIKLREDGSFTVRLNLPDRRQVLPLIASSGDGTQQRTTVLSVERNTKVMEPMSREQAQ